MRQQVAIQTLTEALRKDDAVEAIFLKGSFGRGEGGRAFRRRLIRPRR